ncbi:MAG: D-alanine--D-alanine ligase [Lachnospiraceae bacterium]|nr:D-alanine--D-alanine ligase [Lachnospiraceae bacterium]
MKIVVLAGGTSTERVVSIASGTMVCKALREKKHAAVLVDVFFGLEELPEDLFEGDYDVEAASAAMTACNSRLEAEKKARREFFGPHVLEVCQKADVVFLALHGANGEDGKVQGTFDLFGIPYTGTGYLSSAISMDKGLTKQFFRENGIPTPGGVSLFRREYTSNPADYGLQLPLVVKPCCGGSSVGVYIAHTREAYEKALEDAFTYEDELIVEEYVEGREFSVGVVDGKAYPIIEIAPIEGFYDYTNKYKAGSAVETCPALLTPEQTAQMQKYAEEGAKALYIEGYCRLDFLMREDGRMYCLEANTLPGMTPTSLLPQEASVLGMDYPTLCEELIRLSLKKYQ